ncbi:hypothetical protein Taro_022735 [Colocasia esculenta]|uniref:F-box domain-containing protein n=1 Tax=Colocasia esculenta TaxID=4460 RepID=A0A843V240_COLES|nr:hypothetical protein [Colocasia esculenta]
MATEEREAKRERGAVGGSVTGGPWEELSPELLAEICSRLAADETSRVVPFVCRAWRDVVMGRYCWASIDVEQWCRRVDRTDLIDAAVRKLVRRGRGSLQRLSAFKLGNSAFSVAALCRCLKVLKIPMSEVTDEAVERRAPLLTALTELDISYCLRITHRGIEALGRHCRSLVHLRRNVPPPEMEYGGPSKVDDGEALAVANTMPGLRHLELAYGRLGDDGLNAIVTNCRSLCVLDVRGCWAVKMDGDLQSRCDEIPGFRDPWVDDYDYIRSSSEEGDRSGDGGSGAIVDLDSSDSSDWD